MVKSYRGREPEISPRYGMIVLFDILIFAGSALFYLSTLVPDVLPADNGEFQLVAAVLGVAHPPGYPLHTMLGWLMSQLPIGTIAWRVNLLSVLLAGGTLTLVSASVRRLTGRTTAGVAAAMALGSSTTFWAQATMANVRTPTAFFAALGIYALVRHQQERESTRHLALFAASLTLGLTHHLSLAFVSLFFVLYLFLIDPLLLRQPRRWRRPALLALVCLLPLAYLPWRSGAPLAPDNLRTLRGFFQHILALGFSGDFFFFTTPAELLARLQVMGNVLTFQFHPLILVGAASGALVLLWKDRRLASLLLGGFALHTLITATYRAPQTVEYMLPAYVLLAITLGYGLGCLALGAAVSNQKSEIPPRLAPEASIKKNRLQTAALQLYSLPATLIIVVSLLQGFDHYPSYRTLAQSHDARDYASAILDEAPHDAVVLADWHWAMPLRYLQLVEGVRPDLSIQYVYPTGEPYEQTWVRRIREELSERPVIVTHYHELAYREIEAIFEPLGEAYWVRPELRRDLPAGFTPAHTAFGKNLRVIGARFPETRISPDEFFVFTLAWSLTADPSPSPITLFAHLVGYDGALYAQQDTVLDTHLLAPGDVALTQFQLASRPGAFPGHYSLQIGAYASDGTLLSNSGEERVELLGLELIPARIPPFTQHPCNRRMGDGLALIGADWDFTLSQQPRLYLHWLARQGSSPIDFSITSDGLSLAEGHVPALPAGSYQSTVHTLPGTATTFDSHRPTLGILAPTPKTITIPAPDQAEQYIPFGNGIIYLGYGEFSATPPSKPRLFFGASRPVQRDYSISTSLIGLNPDDTWAWQELDDGIPAMGAIPTLKWIAGSRVTDPHNLTIPSEALPGRVIGTLIIYDAFTGRTLPLLDERLAAAAPWAPLGEWVLQR